MQNNQENKENKGQEGNVSKWWYLLIPAVAIVLVLGIWMIINNVRGDETVEPPAPFVDEVTQEGVQGTGQDITQGDNTTEGTGSSDNQVTQNGNNQGGNQGGNQGSNQGGQNNTQQLLKQPQTAAEIVAMYNSATQMVNRSRPAFVKVRNIEINKITGADKLLENKWVNARKMIAEALGEGQQVSQPSKGENSGQLLTSTLTASDISNASCTKNGNYYELSFSVKDSTNPEKNRNTPLSRFSEDYMTASEARNEIVNLRVMGVSANAKVGTITVNANQTKVTAKINAVTGQPVNINHDFHFDVVLKDLSGGVESIFTFDSPQATGSGGTKAQFYNFVF